MKSSNVFSRNLRQILVDNIYDKEGNMFMTTSCGMWFSLGESRALLWAAIMLILCQSCWVLPNDGDTPPTGPHPALVHSGGSWWVTKLPNDRWLQKRNDPDQNQFSMMTQNRLWTCHDPLIDQQRIELNRSDNLIICTCSSSCQKKEEKEKENHQTVTWQHL